MGLTVHLFALDETGTVFLGKALQRHAAGLDQEFYGASIHAHILKYHHIKRTMV